MALVEALSPILANLLPSDVESFLTHFDDCRHNLFALVVLAWVKEPWAIEYLASRLCSVVSGQQAYKVLAEAAHQVVVPPGMHPVKTDLVQQGVAKTTGFLTALKRMGVIELVSQSPDAGSRCGSSHSNTFYVASSCGLYRLTNNPELVCAAWLTCKKFSQQTPPPQLEADLMPYAEALVSALSSLNGVGKSYVAPHIQRKILTGYISGNHLVKTPGWRIKLDECCSTTGPDMQDIIGQLKKLSPRQCDNLWACQLATRLGIHPMLCTMWCCLVRQLDSPRLRRHPDFHKLVYTPEGHGQLLEVCREFRTACGFSPCLGRACRIALGISQRSRQHDAGDKATQQVESSKGIRKHRRLPDCPAASAPASAPASANRPDAEVRARQAKCPSRNAGPAIQRKEPRIRRLAAAVLYTSKRRRLRDISAVDALPAKRVRIHTGAKPGRAQRFAGRRRVRVSLQWFVYRLRRVLGQLCPLKQPSMSVFVAGHMVPWLGWVCRLLLEAWRHRLSGSRR